MLGDREQLDALLRLRDRIRIPTLVRHQKGDIVTLVFDTSGPKIRAEMVNVTGTYDVWTYDEDDELHLGETGMGLSEAIECITRWDSR